jgi:hypothetical protein
MSFASVIETIAKIQKSISFLNDHDFDVFFAFLKK